MADGPSDERPRQRDRAVFVISVAAELAGVHPQTLRIYERRGLLHPKRTAKNSRRYSERDIERLREIQSLTSQGVNLEGVQRIMELSREVDSLQQRLADLEEYVRQMHIKHRMELEAARRANRRDLVPYSSAVVLYRPPERPG
jgi:MerR family transcriptional regulator/heat shock protein HspR